MAEAVPEGLPPPAAGVGSPSSRETVGAVEPEPQDHPDPVSEAAPEYDADLPHDLGPDELAKWKKRHKKQRTAFPADLLDADDGDPPMPSVPARATEEDLVTEPNQAAHTRGQWRQGYSAERNCNYWVNTATRERMWQCPSADLKILTWGKEEGDEGDAPGEGHDRLSAAYTSAQSQVSILQAQHATLYRELQAAREQARESEQLIQELTEPSLRRDMPAKAELQPAPPSEPEPEPAEPQPQLEPEPSANKVATGQAKTKTPANQACQAELMALRFFLQYKHLQREADEVSSRLFGINVFEELEQGEAEGGDEHGDHIMIMREKARQQRASPRWVQSKSKTRCQLCSTTFSMFKTNTRCFYCGWVVCSDCSQHTLELDRWLSQVAPHELRWPGGGHTETKQVCNLCHDEAPAEIRARQRELADEALKRQDSIERFKERMTTQHTARLEQRLSAVSGDELKMVTVGGVGLVPADVLTTVTTRSAMRFHRTEGNMQIGGLLSSTFEYQYVWLSPEACTIHWTHLRDSWSGREDRVCTESIKGILRSGFVTQPLLRSAEQLDVAEKLFILETNNSHITLVAPDNDTKLQWVIAIQAMLDEAVFRDQAITERKLLEGITAEHYESIITDAAEEIGACKFCVDVYCCLAKKTSTLPRNARKHCE
eukprot:COSAG02_NODE_789_length_17189_cov_23.034114_13_plen_659_part_00